MKDKKTINTEQGLIPIKDGTNKGITCEISKEIKVEIKIRVSTQRYACVCKGLCAWASYMRAYTLTSTCMQDACVHKLAQKP